MRPSRRSRGKTFRREEAVLNDARLPDIGFESYDSMEGLIAIDRSAPAARFGSWPGAKLIDAVYPGLLVAGTIALASTWLAQHYTAPVMLFALLFGMAFHFLHEEGRCVAGIEFTSRSTLAMILYPVFSTSIGLDHKQAGIFIGGTIHDVAQVVGSGYTILNETGDIATYVKLLRVAMLLPAVFAISFLMARHGGHGAGARATLPLFLVGFAVLVVVNSFGLMPSFVIGMANEASRWCLVAAIAALGMKTSFKALFAVGWRPVGLMVAETLWIAALVLFAVKT